MIIFNESALSLIDGNCYLSLLVLVSGEHLRFLGGDHSVSWDYRCHDTSNGLDTEGQWSNVKEDHFLGHVFNFRKDASLNGSSICNCLIWVDSSVWLLAVEVIFDELLNLGNAC